MHGRSSPGGLIAINVRGKKYLTNNYEREKKREESFSARES